MRRRLTTLLLVGGLVLAACGRPEAEDVATEDTDAPDGDATDVVHDDAAEEDPIDDDGLTGGDTSDDNRQDPSDGQAIATSRFQVVVPEHWEVVEEDAESDLIRATSTGEPQNAIVSLQVADGELNDVRELAAAVKSQDQLALSGYQASDWETLAVDGADEALREEISWSSTSGGGAVARRGVNVYLLSGSTGMVLGVQSDDSSFDTSWVEQIVASIVILQS